METKLFNFVFIVASFVWTIYTALMVSVVVDCRAAHVPVNLLWVWIWALSGLLIIAVSLITGNMEHPVQSDEFEDRDDPYAIPLAHNSTCKSCKDWWCCSYVGDLYNINGDCIDEK